MPKVLIVPVVLLAIGVVYRFLPTSKQIATSNALGMTWSFILRWIIFPLLWISLVVVALAVICLVLSHFCNFFDEINCPGFAENVTNKILSLITTKDIYSIEEQEYTTIVSDLLFILTFIITIAPFIIAGYFKIQYARKYSKEQGMETSEVRKKGEDIATMLRYYDGADHITIFCGSFDWLCTYPKMKSFIETFASDDDKLKLISYKTKDVVLAAFTAQEGGVDLFNLLMEQKCFKFNSDLNGVKCSLIKRVGTKIRFLFMQSSDSEIAPFNTCVLNSTDQSRELLHILKELTEPIHWGEEAE